MDSGNLPKYKVIEDDLLNKIKNGTYKPGTLIPKEMELMEIYSVSRPTVRQAIQVLVNKGLLEKRKRRGTIVKQSKISQEFTHTIKSFNAEVKDKGFIPQTHVLFFQKELPNEEVCKSLKISSRDYVYKLVRLRYADNRPIVLVTTYMPYDLFTDLNQYDFNKVSLYDTLDSHDCRIAHVKRKLEVLKADETTADLLNVEINDPLFYFHTVGTTEDNVRAEYSIAKYRGDNNSFEIYIDR